MINVNDLDFPVRVAFRAELKGEARTIALSCKLGEGCRNLIAALLIAMTGDRKAIDEIEELLNDSAGAKAYAQTTLKALKEKAAKNKAKQTDLCLDLTAEPPALPPIEGEGAKCAEYPQSCGALKDCLDCAFRPAAAPISAEEPAAKKRGRPPKNPKNAHPGPELKPADLLSSFGRNGETCPYKGACGNDPEFQTVYESASNYNLCSSCPRFPSEFTNPECPLGFPKDMCSRYVMCKGCPVPENNAK